MKLQIKQLETTVEEWREAFDDLKCKRKEEKAKQKIQYEELKTKERALTVALNTTLDDYDNLKSVRDELKQRIEKAEEECYQMKEKCAKYDLALKNEKGMYEEEKKVLDKTVKAKKKRVNDHQRQQYRGLLIVKSFKHRKIVNVELSPIIEGVSM